MFILVPHCVNRKRKPGVQGTGHRHCREGEDHGTEKHAAHGAIAGRGAPSHHCLSTADRGSGEVVGRPGHWALGCPRKWDDMVVGQNPA